MKVIRLVFTNGRREYLERTIESFNKNMSPVAHTIVSDDSQDIHFGAWLDDNFKGDGFTVLHHSSKLGLCLSIQDAWSAIPEDGPYHYVQHLEEDFVLDRPVDLEEVCEVLFYHPHLAQIWFMRHPWYAAEVEAGGIYQHWGPENFLTKSGLHDGKMVYWTEHLQPFWTHNPSVYPVNITCMRYPYPPQCEVAFRKILVWGGKRSAFWGRPTDEPIVTHIGEVSNKTGN